jgi:hypothetical protein
MVSNVILGVGTPTNINSPKEAIKYQCKLGEIINVLSINLALNFKTYSLCSNIRNCMLKKCGALQS